MMVMGPMWVPNDGSLTLPIIGDHITNRVLAPVVSITCTSAGATELPPCFFLRQVMLLRLPPVPEWPPPRLLSLWLPLLHVISLCGLWGFWGGVRPHFWGCTVDYGTPVCAVV